MTRNLYLSVFRGFHASTLLESGTGTSKGYGDEHYGLPKSSEKTQNGLTLR